MQKKTEFARTLSEYSYFILQTDAGDLPGGRDLVLFNRNRLSEGFEIYAGKRVTVSGSPVMGCLGWRKTLKKGLLVKEITINK